MKCSAGNLMQLNCAIHFENSTISEVESRPSFNINASTVSKVIQHGNHLIL